MSNLKKRLEKLERKSRELTVMVAVHQLNYFYGDGSAVRYVPANEKGRMTLAEFYLRQGGGGM